MREIGDPFQKKPHLKIAEVVYPPLKIMYNP